MSFGYNILGFGSGAGGYGPYNVQFLILAGGGAGGTAKGGVAELEAIESLLLKLMKLYQVQIIP